MVHLLPARVFWVVLALHFFVSLVISSEIDDKGLVHKAFNEVVGFLRSDSSNAAKLLNEQSMLSSQEGWEFAQVSLHWSVRTFPVINLLNCLSSRNQ